MAEVSCSRVIRARPEDVWAVLADFGAAAGWAVMRFVMDAPYRFEPASAGAIILGGALLTLLAGLVFALRPLAARPAHVLRARD